MLECSDATLLGAFLSALLGQIANIKNMLSEIQTRKQYIDGRLKQAGWTILPFQSGLDINSLKCHAVEEFPTNNGPADYLLVSTSVPS